MRSRHVPQRTCIGCQTTKSKRDLVRIVRTPENEVEIDARGKRSGRGAYICPTDACLQAALKGQRLEKALQCAIPADVRKHLQETIDA